MQAESSINLKVTASSPLRKISFASSEFTFPSVVKFINSNKEEDIIWINPSQKYLGKTSIPIKERNSSTPIQLRVVKTISPDGTVYVLLTNLPINKTYHIDDVEKLYLKIWAVEGHYNDEKTSLEIQRFHSKSVNGILQELFAILIITVISKTLMALSVIVIKNRIVEPQFKFTIMSLALDAS